MHVVEGAILAARRKFDIIIRPLQKAHNPGCTAGNRLDNTLLQSKKTNLPCHKYI